MAAEVPQTLKYMGGQLNTAPLLEVENFTNWKKRFMCHITSVEPQFKNIIDNGPFIPMQNDDINLSKLEINTSFMNGLPKKWLSFCQNLKNTNHVKDSELASLFGKLKYEENLIDIIYETEKKKSLVSATPLSTAFISTSIVKDFQDSLDGGCKTQSGDSKGSVVQSSSQYKPKLRPTKDFEAKYNKVKAKLALLSSSASALKSSMVKNKGLIAEAYDWDEEEVSSDDNEIVKVKVFMTLADDNDAVSKEGARNGEWVKISMRKHVNTEILKESQNLKKELKELTTIIETWFNSSNKFPLVLGKKDSVFVKSLVDDTKVSILSVERRWLSEAKGFIFPNHDIGRILLTESQRNTIDPLVVVTDSFATDYDSADESSVCSTPIPLLEKLVGAEPISGPKTIKSILKSNSTFKVEALKGVIINEPSSAHAKGNKSALALKANLAYAGKLKNVKTKDDPTLAIVMKELNELKLKISKNQSSYFRNNNSQKCKGTDHRTCDHAEYISTINMSQHLIEESSQETFSMSEKVVKHVVAQFIPQLITITMSDSEEVKHFKLRKLKCDIRKPIWYLASRCSRHMTDVKSSLHKYEKQPRPKVVFGDDSTCTTKGYGSIKCNCILFITFDEKRGTIFNSNKEVINIAPRVRDVYVLDMISSAQESCFFAKASENLNWLWHKRLAH
ncbi:hypothetical protein Tco_1371509 [Tanacetum coccineum]